MGSRGDGPRERITVLPENMMRAVNEFVGTTGLKKKKHPKLPHRCPVPFNSTSKLGLGAFSIFDVEELVERLYLLAKWTNE